MAAGIGYASEPNVGPYCYDLLDQAFRVLFACNVFCL